MYAITMNITGAFETYGLLAIFVVMLLKEIGVPIPVPGDVIMLSAAAKAASGQLVLWQAFIAILVALVVGDWVQYALIRRLGRPVLDRFGRFIGLTPARLDRASTNARKGGVIAIAVAVITPGVRNVAIPAYGLARVPNRAFLPGLALGSSIFIALHFAIGYLGGPVVGAALHAIGVPVLLFLLALVTLGLVGWLIIRRRTHTPGENAADATVTSIHDWADACCPVCLALGAAQAIRQARERTD